MREFAEWDVARVDANESEQRNVRGVQDRFDRFGKRLTESWTVDGLHCVAVGSVTDLDDDQHGQRSNDVGDALCESVCVPARDSAWPSVTTDHRPTTQKG
jgi:hypothetical protein